MEIRDAEEFRPQMEATLAAQSSRPVDLLIVPDIGAWSAAHCPGAKGSPAALAVVDQATGGWGILVRRHIGASEISSVLDRISWDGRHAAHSILCTPAIFLRHLVLHELAHLANDWRQDKENECDDWAFERLGHAP